MISLALWALLAAADAPAVPPPAPPATVAPVKDWKQEFEEVCGKTQDALQLSDADLRALVRRCDDLKPELEKRPEVERKIYLKRLASCRNLFAYVLDSRAAK
jgi:hypothetical protein